MLPPIISNINSELLSLCNSPNGNSDENGTTRSTRGRYAEISIRKSEMFLETYIRQEENQHNCNGDHDEIDGRQQNHHNNQHHQHQHQHQQQQQQHVNLQVDNSTNTPSPITLQRKITQLHHVQSEESLSSEGLGTSAESSESTEEDLVSDAACSITLVERLIRSHPIWFLPGIQRAGAFHLLQGKEQGNFVVRQSSQSDTMALSVRLPCGKGPYIEHYLIQANKGMLSLETSENRFDSIPSLIAHYSQCCDELPVQLTLPRPIREAKSRQQLSSLALLGQEFWRYPMANPRIPADSSSSNTSSLGSYHGGNSNNNNNVSSPEVAKKENIVLDLKPISKEMASISSPSNTLPKPPLSTNVPWQTRPTPPNTLNLITFNEPLNAKNKEQRNDMLSRRLISPSLVQSIHSSSPIEMRPRPPKAETPLVLSRTSSADTPVIHSYTVGNKTPPPPPPRWAKPGQTHSSLSFYNPLNYVPNQNLQDAETVQSTPSDSTTPPLLSPLSMSISSNSQRSPTTPAPLVLSPTTPSVASKSRKRKDKSARKNSQHYRESDIMEAYYTSPPADKASDYEDIWNTTDQTISKTNISNAGSDREMQNEINEESQFNCEKIKSPSERCTGCMNEKLTKSDHHIEAASDQLIIKNDKATKNEKLSYKEIVSPELTSFKPFHEPKNPDISLHSQDDSEMSRRPDLLSRVCSANSLSSLNTVTQSKNKLNLALAKSNSNSPITPEPKQPSPFYAEPADAIIHRRWPKSNNSRSKYRHSEPGWLQAQFGDGVSSALHTIDWDDSEEAEEKTPLISSSVDHIPRKFVNCKEAKNGVVAKPVHPPKIKSKMNDTSWAVDSSWEFFGNEGESADPDLDCDINEKETDMNTQHNTLTVQTVILQRYPELLKFSNLKEMGHSDRSSSYDNVEGRNEKLSSNICKDEQIYDLSETETILDTEYNDVDKIKRNRMSKVQLDPVLSVPRLQTLHTRESGAGASVRSYALQLATDATTTFSQNIENFIQCTKEGKEASPHVVMRNMRQFMSGMKNYLVKHGEREFEREVEKERLKLKSNEFLNLDAILEGVMMQLVVNPLREHVYKLFVEHYVATGSLKTLAKIIQQTQGKKIEDFGVKSKINPPSETNLEKILKIIQRLQNADSPLEKLEYLLSAISALFNSIKQANSGKHITLGADDLLPLVVWVLVRGKVIDAEVEAEYMWGLLHPSLLTGEAGYYLTTLSSAVHVLKTLKSSQGISSVTNGCGTPDCSSVLRVLVPDELHGSLNTKTLPVRPNMNTREICRILAHKTRCTNPQDHGLFKIVKGEETLLGDQECPQELLHCMFAYKRIDAKIAWPQTTTNGS